MVITFVKNLGLLRKCSLFFLNAEELLKNNIELMKNCRIVSLSLGLGGVRFSSQNNTRSNTVLWIYKF